MDRRKYTEAFKREAVRKCELRGERTVAQVAEELGLKSKHLYNWRRRLEDVTAEARAERGETLEEEVKRLRKENSDFERNGPF